MVVKKVCGVFSNWFARFEIVVKWKKEWEILEREEPFYVSGLFVCLIF